MSTTANNEEQQENEVYYLGHCPEIKNLPHICDYCGCDSENHAVGCPDSMNPFDELLNNGYD